MKHIVILILIIVGTVGCNRPKTISDHDLQLILQEVFLVNAYCSSNPTNCDSIDIYEPILEKYGYTATDMRYTIGNYSKRKSSRLTDVIEEAIVGLERESKIYNDAVAVLDTIDLIAAERFKKIVYQDSLLKITNIRDTSKLRITLPVDDGRYTIAYNYRFDSSDVNYGLRGTFYIQDSAKRAIASNTAWLRTYSREKVNVTLESSDRGRKLYATVVAYNKNATAPNVTIDSLFIVHYLPKKVALDSMNRILMDYKLLIDGKEYSTATQDSCSLRLHPPRSVAKCDSKRRP